MNDVMIIGVGGAGCNMAETFMRKAKTAELRNAQYVFVDADDIANLIETDDCILFNITQNNVPSAALFSDVKKVYILAGLGGHVGTMFTTTLSIQAKLEAKVDYVAVVVTTPFIFEGKGRIQKALHWLDNIKSLNLDLIIAIDNEKLCEKFGDVDVATAFNLADEEALAAVEDSIEPTL